MDANVLIEHIKAVEKIGISTLGMQGRKIEELEYHNRVRDNDALSKLSRDESERLLSNKKFYSTVGLSTDYVHGWIRKHCKDKIVLDYACGNGHHAMAAARAGAKLVVGVDISDVSVRNCRGLAESSGLTGRTYFYHGDCEHTMLPDGCVDIVLCSGMLHHLDLEHALPELRRIIRPGGCILAIEALNYNPFIKLYRILTPHLRTAWEMDHILSKKDLRSAERYFDVRDVRYWHLTSIMAAPLRNTRIFPAVLGLFNGLDRLLLCIPGLRIMSWMFTFEMHKKD